LIEIRDLKVDLGDFTLQHITMDVLQGEFFILLGPTGAGKTVLLEAIAGLYPVLEGEIRINGRDVTKLKPERRGIGIVYQDQVLFPHLSVAKNIAFGLRSKKYPREQIKQKVDSIAELMGISHLLHRHPATLSGGEKQKAALARALVTEPAVLLLDEPLSALDPNTKERMQLELSQLHRRLRVTMILVTHDFEEAVALGERVAVLNDGQIAQIGTPEEILRQPNSEFVARFGLTRNLFSGIVHDGEDGYVLIDINGTELVGITDLKGKVHLSLRPEDILISNVELHSTARNSFEGIVTEIVDRGAVMYVTVDVPPGFICLVTRRSLDELKLEKGVRVWITFKASAVHIF